MHEVPFKVRTSRGGNQFKAEQKSLKHKTARGQCEPSSSSPFCPESVFGCATVFGNKAKFNG